MLVVTALKSIVIDQIVEAQYLGLSACNLGDKMGSLEEVMSGNFDMVFASAEFATDKTFLQALKNSSRFRDNLTALIVDEPHTIDTWPGLRY